MPPRLNFCYGAFAGWGRQCLDPWFSSEGAEAFRATLQAAASCKETVSYSHYIQHRLANEAERLRQQARTLPAGKKRDALLRKARQIDTASHINEWLSSPGLQTPQ